MWDAKWFFLGMHFIWWFVWIALLVAFFSLFAPARRLRLKQTLLERLRRRYAAGQLTTQEYERVVAAKCCATRSRSEPREVFDLDQHL